MKQDPNEMMKYEQDQGFFQKLFAKDQSRVPPSAADPSFLCGQIIRSEDDVLHVKDLPNFGGRLKASLSELLITYLTARYVRIPLVLSFFFFI